MNVLRLSTPANQALERTLGLRIEDRNYANWSQRATTRELGSRNVRGE